MEFGNLPRATSTDMGASGPVMAQPDNHIGLADNELPCGMGSALTRTRTACDTGSGPWE